ncbi:hypothetical protein GCM10023086_76680 [Streptomyces venetus]|uniref:Uncharacterized protein n=1 Tax=Streptomyces venetus TaxID=1701086 RepID=A0ABP8HM36_9ACTN
MAADPVSYSWWQQQQLCQKRSSSMHPRVGTASLEARQGRQSPALNWPRKEEQSHCDQDQPRSDREEETVQHLGSLTHPTANNPWNVRNRRRRIAADVQAPHRRQKRCGLARHDVPLPLRLAVPAPVGSHSLDVCGVQTVQASIRRDSPA